MKRVRPAITQPRSSTDPEAYTKLKSLYLANAEVQGGTRRAMRLLTASGRQLRLCLHTRDCVDGYRDKGNFASAQETGRAAADEACGSRTGRRSSRARRGGC
jgi:hypothetical protein